MQVVRSGSRAVAFALAAMIGAGGLAVLVERSASQGHRAPEAGEEAPVGSRFILTTHEGRTVTDGELHGRHLLVFFGYTHCPDVCPTSLLTVAQVLELLGAAAERVQPVFITVDPARDTPEVLAAFVSHFDPRILGLTGPEAMIERVAKGYRVKYERRPAERDGFYTVDHTASMFHIGPSGEYLGRFGYETPAEGIAARLRAALGG